VVNERPSKKKERDGKSITPEGLGTHGRKKIRAREKQMRQHLRKWGEITQRKGPERIKKSREDHFTGYDTSAPRKGALIAKKNIFYIRNAVIRRTQHRAKTKGENISGSGRNWRVGWET